MAIKLTKNTHHETCPVEAIKGNYGIHQAKLICKRHHKLIQWANEETYDFVIRNFPESYGCDGVKERPTHRPASKEIVFQERDGRIWRNVYSFEQ